MLGVHLCTGHAVDEARCLEACGGWLLQQAGVLGLPSCRCVTCCSSCAAANSRGACVCALGRCPAACSAMQALVLQSVEEMAPLDQQLEKEHQEKTKVKNIEVRVTAAHHLKRPVATAELQCHSRLTAHVNVCIPLPLQQCFSLLVLWSQLSLQASAGQVSQRYCW